MALYFCGRCLDAHCANRGEQRVSTQADLYRVPHRTTAVGEYGWQYAAPMCLHSYLVTREGANRMASALGSCPGLCPADWAPAVMADTADIFTISPALFTQVRARTRTSAPATPLPSPPCNLHTTLSPLFHFIYFFQSTALRLSKDTGATYSAGDIARGLKVQIGNTLRPPLVAECMQRTEDDTWLPESAQAAWFKASGGGFAPDLSTTVQWSYLGAEAARMLKQPSAAELSDIIDARTELLAKRLRGDNNADPSTVHASALTASSPATAAANAQKEAAAQLR